MTDPFFASLNPEPRILRADLEDTIAAIATPLGSGGLGVVRVSGPGAFSVGDKVFRSTTPLSEVPSHTLCRGILRQGDEVLDDAVAAVFRAPRSYTGEDVVEFSCHGSPLLLRRVQAACLQSGARLAEPGEFTKRAFLNGKMDLAQAEAVAALIACRSEESRRWALDQLRGSLSALLESLRKRLLNLLARLEASLDFVDDEVPDLSRNELSSAIGSLEKETESLLATAPRGRLFRDGVRAVLAGRPNVGKSSLFNSLLDADRAIVTETAGTTRDTLEESFLADGLPVTLTDTAGLREGREPIETEGIARARRALIASDVVVWVMDASDPLTEEDRRALAWGDKPAIIVFNKSDLADPGIDRMAIEHRARQSLSHPRGCVFVSARTGEGMDGLRRALADTASPAGGRETGEGPTLLIERHVALLREAADALAAARQASHSGEPDECVALDLRRALDALDRVTGRGVSDEVLDEIFSQFCIGK